MSTTPTMVRALKNLHKFVKVRLSVVMTWEFQQTLIAHCYWGIGLIELIQPIMQLSWVQFKRLDGWWHTHLLHWFNTRVGNWERATDNKLPSSCPRRWRDSATESPAWWALSLPCPCLWWSSPGSGKKWEWEILQWEESRTEKTNWAAGGRTRDITLSPRRIFQCLISFSAAFHPIFLGAAASPPRVWSGGSGGQKYGALRRSVREAAAGEGWRRKGASGGAGRWGWLLRAWLGRGTEGLIRVGRKEDRPGWAGPVLGRVQIDFESTYLPKIAHAKSRIFFFT
jgi:hypothetical protein